MASTRSSSSWVSAGSAAISSRTRCRRRPGRACPSWPRTRPGTRLSRGRTVRCRRCWPGSPCSRATAAALGAQARGVDRAGERFLAGPRLADDQHRQAVARGFGGDRQGGAEFGCGADQLLERERRRELFRHRRKLASGAAAVGIGGERLEQPFGRDRTDQEIGRAGAHRLDGESKRCRRSRAR